MFTAVFYLDIDRIFVFSLALSASEFGYHAQLVVKDILMVTYWKNTFLVPLTHRL